MTLYFEDHKFNTLHAPESAKYEFWCKMRGPHTPTDGSGAWRSVLFAPSDPPYPATPPDIAFKPTKREIYEWNQRVNYWLWSDSAETTGIRRVIDHKTIILDDAYMDSAIPSHPPGTSWYRRSGYSDSCWATCDDHWRVSHYIMWYPRLGCDGLWNLYAYKTRPAQGESLNHQVIVGYGGHYVPDLDQSAPPFDTWQLLVGNAQDTAGVIRVYVTNFWIWPVPCYTYYDAFRLEHVGGSGEGGASAAAVGLGGEVMRVRVAPSPVRRTAQISYAVPIPGRVDVAVYDVTGRAVLRAAQGIQRAGVQAATISVARLPTGTYIARVTVKGVNATCRFVVCR
jgi:hypothetical protein